METIGAVLNRILTTPPGRETARPTVERWDSQLGSRLVPLGTLPKRSNDSEPLFTPGELDRLKGFLKTYADGYALLRDIERTALRQDLSASDAKHLAEFAELTVATIEPLAPVVAAFLRFSAKLAKVQARCRETADEISKLEMNLKLDRVLSGLERLERKMQERSAEQPINTMDELCRRLLAKN